MNTSALAHASHSFLSKSIILETIYMILDLDNLIKYRHKVGKKKDRSYKKI